MYPLDLQEESLKQRVANDFFSAFDYEPLDRIDFAITLKESKNSLFPNIYALWAEAKRGDDADIYASLIQLILTIGANNLHRIHPIPEFIGAFDANKIAFLPYKYIKDFVMRNDFDWTSITPSEHNSEAFLRMQSLTEAILRDKSIIFTYAKDTKELQDFIKNSVAKGKNNPIEIDLENFDSVYLQWYRIVLPTINLNQNAWKYARDNLIALESDFFLADLLSEDNTTINQNLRILLSKRVENAKEKLHYNIKIDKGLFSWNTENIIFLNDDNSTHAQFWNRYKRPPKEEFWDKIYERRDKLSPDDIRERKGAFFTPKMWVQKAQEYLAESLGENWQEEYYIWDCAAGTGNLLVGLKNARNIYASTIDLSDVLIMKELNKNDLSDSPVSTQRNILESHIFQFDFLNDCFFDKVDEKSGKVLTKSKLPESLQNIIKNEPQKLVIFINPPYAEVSSKKPQGKKGVNLSEVHSKYKDILQTAGRELFAQFFIRIYKEIPNSTLASFSTLKYINGSAFANFRKEFKAKFLKGFIIPAWTFDNVKGNFPIGFLVWNLGDKKDIKKCKVNVFNENNKRIGNKNFYLFKKDEVINKWINQHKNDKNKNIGWLDGINGNDFQHNYIVYLVNQKAQVVNPRGMWINAYNLIPASIYLAVRHAIKASWINDRDQFLYPNDKWQKDTEFRNDCLAFTLFHNQNYIKASISPSPAEGDKGGGYSEYINHFIPFSESQVGAKEAFKSDFMVRFINGKLGKDDTASSLRAGKASTAIYDSALPFDKKEIQANTQSFIPTKPLEFSKEAQEVFSTGLALWRYYHTQAKNSDKYLNDASLYDIKEFFQGRGETINGKKGKMNARSEDNHYNDLIAQLRIALQTLADKITPKIYEYEFLLE
ncbi:hypothetical protein [Helicobacter sp. MIT 01-3238]|uniref:hypothetical protein n=1 Tax=Helicobacter sp. MIT 01-3238 TaxID=398627 RepID=UPI000E1E6EF3|nr:hypothetical protein [Helicobacter sp. MIT 01-3238]RDU51368.1 hypothetical protein CQA40_10375 [Helicobacter sp. MIT 01-3238]